MRPDPTSLDIEQPFPPETPPSESVEHAAWREARASLDFLVTSGRRDFVISGDERAGKSQFIAWAERNYGDAVRFHEAGRDGTMPAGRGADGSTPTPIFIRRATPDEIVGFLHERLRHAAFAPETLSRAATDAIVTLADGSVGRANEVASAAFEAARARQARRIDRRDVSARGRPEAARPVSRPAAPVGASTRPTGVPARRRRLLSPPFVLEAAAVLAAGAFVVYALPDRDKLFRDGFWHHAARPLVATPPDASLDGATAPAMPDAMIGNDRAPSAATNPPPSGVGVPGVGVPAAVRSHTDIPPPGSPTTTDNQVAVTALPPLKPVPTPGPVPSHSDDRLAFGSAPAASSGSSNPTLPPGDRAPLLVAVRYPAGAVGAALAAEQLATRLTNAGIAVDGPSPLRARMRPGISYAFAEDAAAASRLAASLGPALAGAVPEAMNPSEAVDARPGQIDIVVTDAGNPP